MTKNLTHQARQQKKKKHKDKQKQSKKKKTKKNKSEKKSKKKGLFKKEKIRLNNFMISDMDFSAAAEHMRAQLEELYAE